MNLFQTGTRIVRFYNFYMDRYCCFDELRMHETGGRDFRIRLRQRESQFAIMAPHGGGIERGTSQLAEAIAGDEHSFYVFEGIKHRNNPRLHITSDRFDEPQALDMVRKTHTVITVHGAKGQNQAVYTGGLHHDLEMRIQEALVAAGFTAEHDPSPTRQGRGKTNICNRGYGGKGVQLELTRGLRKQMFDPVDNGRWLPNEIFRQFVMAVRSALADAGDTL